MACVKVDKIPRPDLGALKLRPPPLELPVVDAKLCCNVVHLDASAFIPSIGGATLSPPIIAAIDEVLTQVEAAIDSFIPDCPKN